MMEDQEDECRGRMRRLDGPFSWLVCICASLCSLLILGCSYTYGILFPSILDEFQAGKAVTAFVGSIAVANSGLFGPIAGKLCDRFGCQVVVLVGGLSSALGLLASSFAPNIVVLYVTYSMIFGVGSCLVYIAAYVAVPPYFDKRRSLAIAAIGVGPGAGLFVMSPVVQALMESLTWRKTLMALSGIALTPCILAWALVKREYKYGDRKEVIIPQTEDMDHEVVPRRRMCHWFDFSFLKNAEYVLFTSVETLLLFGHMMPAIHLAKHCSTLGIPSARSFWAYFIIGLTSMVSRILTGRLCDTGWVASCRIWQTGALVLAIADLLLPLTSSFTMILVYSVAYGVGDGITATSMACIILNCLPPALRGQGIGVYYFFVSLSVMFAPPLAGLIADLSGSYSPAFYTAGSIELVSTFLPLLNRLISYKTKDQGTPLEHYSLDLGLIIVEKETVL